METLIKEKKSYSLLGDNSLKAIRDGLAEATWYQAPVSRAQMRELLARKDGPAIRDTIIWFGLLFGFGYLMYILWGTWWVVFPIMAYSVIYASSSDSRWHESSHGTAFKTDWMNNWLYELSSFMVFRNSVSWRWSHTRHHSDTIIVGRDPEIAVPRPPDIKGIILNLFGFKSVPPEVKKCVQHIMGKIDEEEKEYLPKSQYNKAILVSRIWLLVYASVIGLAFYLHSWLPLFYIGLPTLLGSYMITVYGLTQHAGLAENVLDHRLNCRTVYMNRVHRFLYWNMNYHLEHHMFPLVPYHNLPKLHELVKDYCPTPYNGIIETYKEIIPAILKQVNDPEYFVKRSIPAGSEPVVENQATTFKTEFGDGKVIVCSVEDLPMNDVVRLDCGGNTYAVYRTATGKYYATDGICTHGSTHLAEGLVIGDQIECPKHNGRFSIVDGSVQRPPVCVALRTYNVSVKDHEIWLDLNSAGGLGQEKAEKATSFKVISNKNVATYIKELVLEPLNKNTFNFRAGDYVQLEIPVHATPFHQFEVSAPYNVSWKGDGLFLLKSVNLVKTKRNYSMASNPEKSGQLRFNVRIALPPKGQSCQAGIGSSYVYSLKEGDMVSATGPYGDFHIKETNKEMVYIGGGAGMAPLRSHISTLFESQKTKRKVSFWYGARSLQDLFYNDYFKTIQQENENFQFEVAFSEPGINKAPGFYEGFIHEVINKEYLSTHPKLDSIEFYLCGPPLMIEACQNMLKSLGVDKQQISFDEF